MHKLLFIIPTLKTGGTNSSLSALYTYLKNSYDIKVFSLSNQRNAHFSFDEAIIKTPYLFSAFHEKIDDAKLIKKPLLFFLKTIRSVIKKIFLYDILDFFYSYKSKQIERTSNYSFIIAFEESYPTKFVSLFGNKNKIAWIHCNYNMYCPKGCSEENIYESFSHIICVSKYTSSLFSSRYPNLANRVDYIYNFINADFIESQSKLILNDSSFKTEDVYVLISAGRVDPVKRFSCIPQIANCLIHKGLKFKWYIIGPISVQAEYEKLMLNIQRYGVHEYVFYLGNKSNPYFYFAHSDLYICTSESEACPMVFNEAILLRTPVVTADFGSASEFITNGKNGYVCSLNNMADVIYGLLEDSGKLSLIKNGMNSVKDINLNIITKLNDLLS